MIPRMLIRKNLTFERSYRAPLEAVWRAWTRPEELSRWWGPEKTSIVACEVDLRVGGRIEIVMEAGEGMGRYQGTRWPMVGSLTLVEAPTRLVYDARSWTEGEEETATVEHTNELTLTADGDVTHVALEIAITSIGSGAKLAAFGMKWGYEAQLDKLAHHLESGGDADQGAPA